MGEYGVKTATLTSGLSDERRVQRDVVGLRPELVQCHPLHAELPTLGACGHRVVTDRLRHASNVIVSESSTSSDVSDSAIPGVDCRGGH